LAEWACVTPLAARGSMRACPACALRYLVWHGRHKRIRLMLSILRRHGRLIVGMVCAMAVAYPSFFSVTSFWAALTPQEAIAKWKKPLPEGWSAGVMNHGEYSKWWTIRERPVLFAISLTGLVCSIGFLWFSMFWIVRRRPQQSQTTK